MRLLSYPPRVKWYNLSRKIYELQIVSGAEIITILNVLFCTNCHCLWFSFRCNYPSPLAYSKCLAQRASVLVLLQRWTSLNLLIDAAVPLFCSDCHCYRHLFSITIVIVFYWHPVSLSSIVIVIFLTPSNLLISLFIAIAINCLFHLYWLSLSWIISLTSKTRKEDPDDLEDLDAPA